MRSTAGMLIAGIFLLLAAWPHQPSSRAQELIPSSRAERFGVYNWNVNDGAFPGGDLDRLN